MNETSDVSKNRYYVYILFSLSDKGFYIGYSTNLKKRLSEHARGEVKSTKNRRPLKLIHYEYFINVDDAKAREVFLISGFGRGQLKKTLSQTLTVMRQASFYLGKAVKCLKSIYLCARSSVG